MRFVTVRTCSKTLAGGHVFPLQILPRDVRVKECGGCNATPTEAERADALEAYEETKRITRQNVKIKRPRRGRDPKNLELPLGPLDTAARISSWPSGYLSTE